MYKVPTLQCSSKVLSEQNFHDVECLGARTRGATSTLILAVTQSSRLLKACGRKETTLFSSSILYLIVILSNLRQNVCCYVI
jgi:hypothetical protein